METIMKVKHQYLFMFVIILIVSLPVHVFSENNQYSIYKMYNNSFQAIHANKPIVLTEMPLTHYSEDQTENLFFSTQFADRMTEYDIREYKQSAKSNIDQTIKDALVYSGYTVTDFSSELDRNNNEYIAIYTVKTNVDNIWAFQSTKYIIYGKKLFKWTVIYYDAAQINIFNKYKDHVKVIK